MRWRVPATPQRAGDCLPLPPTFRLNAMLLALKKSAPSNATLSQRFTSWIIKARLVSQYCHGAIVVDGDLYQANTEQGMEVLRREDWTPERWDLFSVEGDDEGVLRAFDQYRGAAYDWLSLLAFVGLRVRDSSRLYCYEWCWIALTGDMPKRRITPELLLAEHLRKVSSLAA
jgi:hypothetical protein